MLPLMSKLSNYRNVLQFGFFGLDPVMDAETKQERPRICSREQCACLFVVPMPVSHNTLEPFSALPVYAAVRHWPVAVAAGRTHSAVLAKPLGMWAT